MRREPESRKQLISIALREYDALRKGIDDRLDVTKTYGWPVVLVAVGAIAGLKSELVNVNTALAFVPAIVFSIAALDANANHDKARARRALALVEDRIFILAEREAAMCYESMAFLKCKARALTQLKSAIAYTLLYALIEIVTCLLLLRPNVSSIDWRSFLMFSVLSIPAVILIYSSYGIYRIFTAPLSTLLLTHILESKTANADGTRLLYNTRQLAISNDVSVD